MLTITYVNLVINMLTITYVMWYQYYQFLYFGLDKPGFGSASVLVCKMNSIEILATLTLRQIVAKRFCVQCSFWDGDLKVVHGLLMLILWIFPVT